MDVRTPGERARQEALYRVIGYGLAVLGVERIPVVRPDMDRYEEAARSIGMGRDELWRLMVRHVRPVDEQGAEIPWSLPPLRVVA